MASPAHRAVILRNDLREIGAGYIFQANDQPNVVLPGGALGGPYYHYWVQNFGARYDVYPVIIDAEALATENQDVQLSVYGSEWATQMMVANTADFAGATWQAYQSTLAWTLAAGSGEVGALSACCVTPTATRRMTNDDIRLDAGAADRHAYHHHRAAHGHAYGHSPATHGNSNSNRGAD